MGQYFIIVNLDKREYIHPHDLQRGAKLSEFRNDVIIKKLMSFLMDSSPKENTTSLYFCTWVNNPVILVGDFDDYFFFKQVVTSFKNVSKSAYDDYLRLNEASFSSQSILDTTI